MAVWRDLLQPLLRTAGQDHGGLAGGKIADPHIAPVNAPSKSCAKGLGTSLLGGETLGVTRGPVDLSLGALPLLFRKQTVDEPLAKPLQRPFDSPDVNNIVAEANELFSPSGRIGFQVAKNFQLPIQGEAVFCFNVLRYYNGNDFDEIVGLLGQGVRENGILVVGNNDVNDPRVLTAFVFQKVRGRMQKQTVIFGSVERLDERFVDTLKGLPRADKDVMAFRRDLPAARMESLRGEVFSLDQGLKDRGYRVFPAYGLVVKTLNDLRRDITGSAPRPEMKIIRDVFPAQQSVQQGI